MSKRKKYEEELRVKYEKIAKDLEQKKIILEMKRHRAMEKIKRDMKICSLHAGGRKVFVGGEWYPEQTRFVYDEKQDRFVVYEKEMGKKETIRVITYKG